MKFPKGCKFNPRCEFAEEICRRKEPELKQIEENHSVRCHFWEKVEEAKRAEVGERV